MMALTPWVTPMDVVFSFDTTGSMSQALDEVKARVTDIIQKLQADIPGIRVGIIAHGDYCDAEHFYDIRSLDLSDSVADVVTFVNDTEGTGGGDVPECYELALQVAKNMAWRAVGIRVLVMIGDAYPHEPEYHLNVQKINWRNELAELASMNVHIYGVQVQNDELSTQFFTELAKNTSGQHLQLSSMGRVCDVIIGICYREQSLEMFQNYEAEIRQKEADKLGPDLECAFGTLRHEVSRTSDITAILDRDEDEVDMNDDDNNDDDEVIGNRRPRLKRVQITESIDNRNDDEDDVVRGNGKHKLKQLRFSEIFKDDDDDDDDDDNDDDDHVKGNGKPCLKRLMTVDLDSDDGDYRPLPAKRKRLSFQDSNLSDQSPRKILAATVRTSKTRKNSTSKYTLASKSRDSLAPNSSHKQYREHVPLCNFTFSKLNWSTWQIAVCPKEEMKKVWVKNGQWKNVLSACGGGESSLWRTDLLSNIPATRGRSLMFEMSIMAPGSHKRKVVNYHITKPMAGRGMFSLPWYRSVFRSVRPMINRAASQNCKIFIRWTCVPKRCLNKCRAVGKEYNYAWKAQPPRPCF